MWTDAGPELRVGVKSRSTMVETDGYEAALAAEKEHEAAERLRLLYVAMTARPPRDQPPPQEQDRLPRKALG